MLIYIVCITTVLLWLSTADCTINSEDLIKSSISEWAWFAE